MKRIFRFLLVAALAIIAVACAKDIVDFTGDITGVVKDDADGHLIENCQVSLGTTGRSVITNADGQFTFEGVESGDYQLTFKRSGYNDVTKNVTVVNGQTTRTDVMMKGKSNFEMSTQQCDFGELANSMKISFYNHSSYPCDYNIKNVPDWAKFSSVKSSIPANGTVDITIEALRDKLASYGVFEASVLIEYGSGSSATLHLSVCKVEPQAPTLATGVPKEVTTKGFMVEGEILSTGGSTVKEYGHCWSKSNDVTLYNCLGFTKFTNADNPIAYSSKIENLTPGTTYYVCSYATNNTKTGYGDVMAITTQSENSDPAVELNAAPLSCNFSNIGGNETITVKSNSSWTASAADSWVMLSSTSGTGDGTFKIIVGANDSKNERNSNVAVKCGGKTVTIQISQNGKIPSLDVSPQNCTFASSGGSETITVNSNDSWTVSSSDSWVKLSSTSGTGNGTFMITTSANESENSRNGSVIVKNADKSVTIQVSQGGKNTTLSVTPLNCTLLSTGSEQAISVTSNSSWTVIANDTWVKLSSISGSGNGTFKISATANTDNSVRNSNVIVKCGKQTETINVKQNAPSTVSSSTCHFASTGGTEIITVSSDVDWNIKSNSSWLTVNKGSGNGNGNFVITAAANTSSNNRNGSITLTFGSTNFIISVMQNAGTSIERNDYGSDTKYGD